MSEWCPSCEQMFDDPPDWSLSENEMLMDVDSQEAYRICDECQACIDRYGYEILWRRSGARR